MPKAWSDILRSNEMEATLTKQGVVLKIEPVALEQEENVKNIKEPIRWVLYSTSSSVLQTAIRLIKSSTAGLPF
jgi:hypothetical protein